MTRKAIPDKKRLPVRNQTTKAMMAAGRRKRIALAMTTIMTRPMIRRTRERRPRARRVSPEEGEARSSTFPSIE